MLQNDREPDEEWILPYVPDNIPNSGPDDPDGPDNGGDGPGGNNDPDGPGGNNNPVDPNNPMPNNRNWQFDPFSDMISQITRRIARNQALDKQRQD